MKQATKKFDNLDRGCVIDAVQEHCGVKLNKGGNAVRGYETNQVEPGGFWVESQKKPCARYGKPSAGLFA